MASETRLGSVVAVCMSPEHGFPTYPQEFVVIGMLSIDGDAHSGPDRQSFMEPNTRKPNDRPISIVSDEIRVWANTELGLSMEHGDFNEQVVVTGLGDLGDIPIGSILTFTGGVVLEVVDRAYPCAKLEAHNGPGLIGALAERNGDEIYSRRGILCKVIQPGELRAGVAVTVVTL